MDTNPITQQTEQILIEHYERFYRLAYSYVQNREDALDVVQESACKAIRDCGQVKNPAYLSTVKARLYREIKKLRITMEPEPLQKSYAK